jgi:putative tryptophan/tyrosine transport system substrate-binding protein
MPVRNLGAVMRRREFITLIGGAAATWPLGARAQQPSKTMKRMALVSPSDKITDMFVTNPIYGPFFKELSRLGYVEGDNLIVERYSANGQSDHFDELARDVVSTHPDVIRTVSTRLALALKKYTATIPIVALCSDPVADGLVSSLARPGGNITGVSVDAGIEIWGKRLGLLLEAIQKPSNVQFLATRAVWESAEGQAVRDAAKQAGISVTAALLDDAIDESQYRRVFTAMEQDRVEALMISDQAENFTYRQLIVNLAAKSQIPTIYPYREHVALGGLMAYAVDIDDFDLTRQTADMVGEILKGTNPADMPFYQPTKFQLVINVNTAKALGLEIPPSLLLRADGVIE